MILCFLRRISSSAIPVEQPTIGIPYDGVPIDILVVEVMLISPQIELDGRYIVRLEFGQQMRAGDDRLG